MEENSTKKKFLVRDIYDYVLFKYRKRILLDFILLCLLINMFMIMYTPKQICNISSYTIGILP